MTDSLKDPSAEIETDASWYSIAQEIVSAYVGRDIPKDAVLAQMAVRALLCDLNNHPSNMNTAFVLTAMIGGWMQFPAFCLVVNGLTGYFQWVTHNGGKFSVLDTLFHLDIMTLEEAKDPKRFEVCCTDTGCNYLVINHQFLKRIVRKFHLPFSVDLGGSPPADRKDILAQMRTLRHLFGLYPKGNSKNSLARLEDLIRAELE